MQEVWVGLEMTKKEMAAKIAELEKQVKELTDALMALALKPIQPNGYVFIPAPNPIVIPYMPPIQPTWPPYYPRTGDPAYPLAPTITCSTNVCSKKQDYTIIN